MNHAHYDANGNIILEPKDVDANSEKNIGKNQLNLQPKKKEWNFVEDNKKPTTPAALPKEIKRTKETPSITRNPGIVRQVMSETELQFKTSKEEVRKEILFASKEVRGLPARVRGGLTTFWRIANSPVRMRGNTKRKEATKLQLFITDTIRFGGTFSLIFGVLFLSVNYQSFFQIARAELALGTDIEKEQALEKLSTGAEKAYEMQSVRRVSDISKTDILSYLPAVGPYEDRLIIPKLGKNVPIVRPSMNALMKQDWKTFEGDIQTALRDGVVHYPGSARPGQAGNFFVTGHSSYYPWDDGKYKDVFARLSELVIGDTYSVYYGGDKHTYRITKKYEVKPSDVSVLDQPTHQRIATLMTCTPIGTTLRRLILVAEEIDPATGEVLAVGQKAEESISNPFTRLEALPI